MTNTALGHTLTGYFLVNSRGYKTAIAASRGFDEGFFFISNVSRGRTITNLRDMHNYITNRFSVDPKTVIEDSEGNRLTREELFDFAAYSRGRTVARTRKVTLDKDGFKFVYLSQEESSSLYATTLLGR
uniref:Uncharacterized protein n=1 Tax=Ochrobactrum phage ORM_20 TaxID=2985243 RepID=A0A9N6WZL6_9VIRU|nr:hypothetical protein ORM20_00206 [Ochrobactrum phage ORM_20]